MEAVKTEELSKSFGGLQVLKDAKAITTKNGKPATQDVCPVCGTKMFLIGKS